MNFVINKISRKFIERMKKIDYNMNDSQQTRKPR